jgi:hypothetical protein
MSSSVSHKIKNRKKANDVFITPLELAKVHIDFIPDEYKEDNDMWLDPCKNDGSYYNQFPEQVCKDYCEILEDKDFLEYPNLLDIRVIIQNPPYSIIDKWIAKNIELQPDCCSFLIGLQNLTARRIQMFEDAGYKLTKMKMLKVWKWYGMSVLVNFEQTSQDSIIEIDRKVYK